MSRSDRMDTLPFPSILLCMHPNLPETQNQFKLLSARIGCIRYHLSQPVPVPRRLAAGASRIVPRASVSLALVLLRVVRASLVGSSGC